MNQSRNEEELIRQLHSLRREIPPANDAWEGIARRIDPVSAPGHQRRPGVGTWPMAVAAGIFVAFVAGLIIDRQQTGARPTGFESAPELSDATESGEFYGAVAGAVSEPEYRAAFREFLALHFEPAQTVAPGSEPVDFGWDVTRQVEIALTAALHREPENVFLKERLKTLRARQLELLQTIAALEMASRRNAI